MSEARPPAEPNPDSNIPNPERIVIAVNVARVPGGELRIVQTLGEWSVALKLEDTIHLARLLLDSCDKVKAATFTEPPTGLQ